MYFILSVGSFVFDTKGQRPFLAYTSVQMDKTKESIQEIQKDLAIKTDELKDVIYSLQSRTQ